MEPAQKTIWHLEMSSRDALRPPKQLRADLEFRQLGIPDPEFNWFMNQTVGAEFRWGGRTQWGPAEWEAYVNRPELETWVGYVSGTPVGYAELERQSDGGVQILRFGLRGMFFGQGLGGTLLTRAVERCWDMGANRVFLTTCNYDHPHARDNYFARGFRQVNQTAGPPNHPWQSVLCLPVK